jgi:SAM-dependent methyltransferase
VIPDLLREILVCPGCRGKLLFSDTSVVCQDCLLQYPVSQNVPVLITPDSPFRSQPAELAASSSANGSARSWLRRLLRPFFGFNPPLTTWIDRTLFQHLNECTEEMRILNLGSGVGQFDEAIGPHLRMINLDVSIRRHVDVLADAHQLPFADESLDAVYSNAVLEHVQRPWKVADEIYRVLRPGGKILINLPFLNIIHDTHDYFRFTDRGLQILFSKFRQVDGGVSAGPASFLGPFLVEYLLYFVPTRYLKALFRPVVSLLMWPLKFLDYPIRRDPRLRLTADAFYYVGVKDPTCPP